MKRELIKQITYSLLIVGVLVGIFFLVSPMWKTEKANPENEKPQTTYQQPSTIDNTPKPPYVPRAPDYSNFIQILSGNEMVSDIPKNANISLMTYNFETGEREIEKTYLLKRNSVEESSEVGEIQISIHSKYVNQFNSNNLCSVLSTAKTNGDFGTYTDLETGEILWRYRSMLKYRDCLGL